MFLKPLYSLSLIDNKDVRSRTEDVLILICTNCSGQGTCITDQPRDNDNIQFSLLVCNCSTGWEGKKVIDLIRFSSHEPKVYDSCEVYQSYFVRLRRSFQSYRFLSITFISVNVSRSSSKSVPDRQAD